MTINGVCVQFAVLLLFVVLPSQTLSRNGIKKESCISKPPLGLEDNTIPDSSITASSYRSVATDHNRQKDMKAAYARLNNPRAWCAGRPHNSWLMVDLGDNTVLTGVATQGIKTVYNHFYVKSYRLQYSLDGILWENIQEHGLNKTFKGNSNGFDIIRHDFDAVQARYFKIVPLDYKYKVCLRAELYGCVINGTSSNQTSSTSSTTVNPPATSQPLTTLILPTEKVSTTTTSKTTTSTVLPMSSTKPASHSKPASSPKPLNLGSTTTDHISIITLSTQEATKAPIDDSLDNGKKQSLSGSRNKSETRKDLILGFTIFGGLVAVIMSLFIVFLVLRRRSRKRQAIQFQRCGLSGDECLCLDDKVPCIDN